MEDSLSVQASVESLEQSKQGADMMTRKGVEAIGQ